MQRPPDELANLFSIGVTFRSAPQALRERLEVAPEAEIRLLQSLRGAGLDEALVLSTCDRVEILGIAKEPQEAGPRALDALAAESGVERGLIGEFSLQHRGGEALKHLFAIAASLESQTIGEPQVLGQVKEARQRAEAAGAVGPLLRQALDAAFAAAKRVRRETRLGERPVSLAAAALRSARTMFGDLSALRLLLVGLGETGELLAWEFRDAGITRLTALHENPLRAQALALRFQGHHGALGELPALLPAADIVITAVGAGRPLIDQALLRPALKARRGRPILLFDTVLPPDLADDLGRLDAAFPFSLDDLERLAAEGKAERAAEVEGAATILSDEVSRFYRALTERQAAPDIALLREEAERLRREVLAERPASADEATQLLLKRLLHQPSLELRRAASEGEAGPLSSALRRLFRLGGDKKENP